MNISNEFKIGKIRLRTVDVTALEPSFLQETRTCIKAWMSSNSNQIRPLTTELPALERLKNHCIMFLLLQFLFWDFFSVNEWSICFSKANSNYFQGKQLTN